MSAASRTVDKTVRTGLRKVFVKAHPGLSDSIVSKMVEAATASANVVIETLALAQDAASEAGPNPDRLSEIKAHRRLERFRKTGTDWAGACAGSIEIADRLGKSRSTIDQWRTKGSAIAWKDGKRNYTFPLGQFGDTAPLNGIAEVLDLATTPKRAWIWLKSRHAAFDGQSPVELLREEHVEEVVAAAKRDLVF